MNTELVPVSVFKHPFDHHHIDLTVPYGLTVSEIIEVAQPDPVLRKYGVVYIGGQEVPENQWLYVRPKVGTVIRVLPRGGGGGRLLATIGLAVAVIALTFIPGGIFLAPLLAIGGTLLINHFMPPPVPKISKGYGNDPIAYSINGTRNRISDVAYTKLPYVCGRFKVVPPYCAQPFREVISGQIYFRALFAFGHGPLHFESWSIGSTDISEFQGVEIEVRRGYWSFTDLGGWNPNLGFPQSAEFADTYTASQTGVCAGVTYRAGQTITFNDLAVITHPNAWDIDQQKPFSLFPDDIFDDDLSVDVDSPTIRTSKTNASMIAIGIVFDKGICHLENNPPGRKKAVSISVMVEQSPAGAHNWTTVVHGDVTGIQTTPLYWGWQWEPKNYGAQDPLQQYDVRIRNVSGVQDEERNFGNFTWYSLRTITTGSPVPVSGIAMIALRIKASGQLSGVLDQFSAVCWSICRDFDATTYQWKWRITNQPAALFRHILQDPHRKKPLPDSRIDLERLAYWDSITRSSNRVFNGVFDSKGKLLDALIEICKVGRASPALRDLKMSVIIDEPKTTPLRMFTPANSSGYSGEMSHALAPHAYRIGFIDANNEWSNQEIVVYDDGYTAANATDIDRVEWPGITNSDQAWKEGRFHIAQQRLRREIYRITTDFEFLACERGDLVALQHDVIAVGMASGRVTAITTSGGNVLTVTVACGGITMIDGQSYGMRVRKVIGGSQQTDLYKLITVPGEQTTFTLSGFVSINDGPAIGDLCAIGIYDRETIRCIVKDIQPKQDITADLTLISEAAGVHIAELGAIPAYDPVVTFPFKLPTPIVLNMTSDARVMVVAGRILMASVVFTLRPPAIDGVTIHVTYLATGTDGQWQEATVQEDSPGSCRITGLDSGTQYDFRLYYSHRDYLSSDVSAVNGYYVIGRSDPPSPLVNLSIASNGGIALLTWDLPLDIDVQYGGWISFRHTPVMDGTEEWTKSLSIGRVVNGDQNHVWLPLKPGVYFGRVFDVDGRPSTVVSITTKQASVLTYVGSGVSDIQEDPTFPGVKTNCEVVGGILKLTYSSGIDGVLDMDDVPSINAIGSGITPRGIYQFAAGFDFTTVQNVRLTAHVYAETENLFATVDSEDLWDSMEDVDGIDGVPVDASVWIKTTDDDPAGNPTWGDWILLHSAEVNCRAVGEIALSLWTEDLAYNILVSELRIVAEKVS